MFVFPRSLIFVGWMLSWTSGQTMHNPVASVLREIVRPTIISTMEIPFERRLGGFSRPSSFVRPHTTRRPFKKRPTKPPISISLGNGPPAPDIVHHSPGSSQVHNVLGEMSQPPFDSGPYKPPSPPPAPVHSDSNLEILPAPPGKPQRPLPPPRPAQYQPRPWPNPPLKLPPAPPGMVRPSSEEPVKKPELVFNVSTNNDDGSYSFEFLVDNSVYRKEQGFYKKSTAFPGRRIFVKTGSYSFVSPEGTFHRIDYIADEFGYRAFAS